MSNIHLVHSFVVEQILSITTKCKFQNYGGNNEGLYGRIMGTFHICETGYLQSLYKEGEKFTFEPLISLIKSKLQKDQLDDLIDIWKEICNRKDLESTVMHFAGLIESAMIHLGHHTNHFLYLEAPIWTTKLKSVDNAIKSASDYLEKVLNSETSAKYEKYLYRLSRTLNTHPYIQKTFIEFNFSKLLLNQLEDISDIKLRTDALKDKIKEEQNAITKETKAKGKESSKMIKVEVKKEADPMPSFPPYPNLTEEEELMKDSLYMQLIKAFVSSELEKLPSEELLAVIDELIKRSKAGMDRVNKIETIAKRLDDFFKGLTGVDPETLKGDCQDLDCPVHGSNKVNIIQDLLKTKCPDDEELHEHQQRIVDLITGINPQMEAHIGFLNLGPNQRSESYYDFNGMLKFIENHFDPEPKKPTATEIETYTNVVINQKFVIHDVKGEFFCEYKMTWTPTRAQFTFTHDKPNNGETGRRFYPIHELNRPMTQDEAFKEFQSLHRVALENPHKPKPNPFSSH